MRSGDRGRGPPFLPIPAPGDGAEAHPSGPRLPGRMAGSTRPRRAFARRCASTRRRAASWLGLARIQEERGDFELLCQSARSALAVAPKLAEAYGTLASILGAGCPTPNSGPWRGCSTIRRSHPSPAPCCGSASPRSWTTRALRRGRGALRGRQRLQSSGKSARGLAFDHDRRSVRRRIIETFTPEFLARRRGWGDPDPRPVFVVGLPRSGTTLTEQMLASHPGSTGPASCTRCSTDLPVVARDVGEPAVDPFDALDRLTPIGPGGGAALHRRLDERPRDGRAGRRQAARQHRPPRPDRPALARGPRDPLPQRPRDVAVVVLADRPRDQSLEQRLGPHRPAVRRSSAGPRALGADPSRSSGSMSPTRTSSATWRVRPAG